jgi:ribulose-phosphate 3-epimerase
MFELILAPSILAGNHAHLAESEAVIAKHGLKWVHLDIMDGHFVPNLSFGPQTLSDLRKVSNLLFDTHLMLDNPHLYIDAFAQAGADNITVHVEPDYPILETLVKIRTLGKGVGISLKPHTGLEALEPYWAHIDLLLIMTVEPGFGGQTFESAMLPKIQAAAALREKRGLAFRIEVDGGITSETVTLCRKAGADTFVAGTAFFKAENRDAFIQLCQG